MCSLLPEELNSEHILYSVQLVVCRVAVVKSLPVHHHIAVYILSDTLGSLQFENRVPLKPVSARGRGWLVGLGLTALRDSISVCIGPSPREREKEERNDR